MNSDTTNNIQLPLAPHDFVEWLAKKGKAKSRLAYWH